MGLTAASIYDLKLLFQFHQTVQGLQNLLRLDREATAIFVGPILCTNLLSTSFIAWKAWYVVWFLVSVLVLSWRISPNSRDYHRTVSPHIRKGRPSGRVEKVLMLLIESDIVYCILWVISLWHLSVAQSSTLNSMCRRCFTCWLRSAFFLARAHTSSIWSCSTFRCVSGRVCPIINWHHFFQSTYPVSVNVLAVTTQPYEFSEGWVQSVQ